jgi:hypothetical protein
LQEHEPVWLTANEETMSRCRMVLGDILKAFILAMGGFICENAASAAIY